MRRRARPIASLLAALPVALAVLLCAARSPAQPHEAPDHAEEGQASRAEHDENAAPPPINWWHGLLGTKQDVEPNLLWRAPQEPAPYLAALINFGALIFILAYFGRAPLASALKKRKESIMHEIEDARRAREAAERRLKEYEAKIERIGEDIERLRLELREQGERDKARILAEANERRERMKQDAQLMLSREIEQMRRDLMKEAVDEASRLATELLAQRMTLADHDRFVEAFFTEQYPNRAPGAPTGASS
jgi:F-type H+-transporting ATPase subunit b